MNGASETSFVQRFDEFHQLAVDNCGWNDFGEDEYLPALNILLESLDQSALLPKVANAVMAQSITGVLSGRLYSEHYKQQNPGFSQQKIARPLFIIGLPRSGTTALQKLLAADPCNQGLAYWLGQTPMPRPARERWQQIPEFMQCVTQLETIAQAVPEMMAIHEMAADQADECRLLLMQSFSNVTFQSGAWVPEYEEWLYTADFSRVYERYKSNLQLIGLNDDRRWVLKDPSHLWAPQDLLKVFPDACIVQTHRQPEKLIPSVSSLVYTSRKMTDPEVDKKRVGRRELKQWARVLNNLAELRQNTPQLPIYDVYMEDLQRDPLQTIRGIYDYFDIALSPGSHSAMESWAASRPAGVHGQHNYTAEEFGLNDEEINEAFQHYIFSLRSF